MTSVLIHLIVRVNRQRDPTQKRNDKTKPCCARLSRIPIQTSRGMPKNIQLSPDVTWPL
jgi:hypothetical protein